MDGKDTFYCSFVSDHYIICECGDTFPSEDALKEHLENGHDNKNEIEKLEEDLAANDENAATKEENVAADEENVAAKEENVAANEVVYNDVKKLCVLNKHIKKENRVFELPAEIEMKSEEKCDNNEETVEEDQYVYEILPVKMEPENGQELEQVVFEDPNDEESQYLNEVPIEVILQNQMSHEHNYKKAVKLEVQEFFFCEVCGKSFTSEKSVKKHANMHIPGPERIKDRPKQKMRYDKTKKVVCELCGKKYASNAALRYHQRVHTGEKPYACGVCSKSFTMPLFLQIHTRIHTGERPYQCSNCPKAFSNKAALLRHDRVHTGEKPYSCPQCFKTFTQSNSMKLHVKTVHLKMPTPYKSKARRLKALMRQAALQQDGIKSKSKQDVAEGVSIKLVPTKQVLYEVEDSQEGELVYDDEEDSRVMYHEVYEGE